MSDLAAWLSFITAIVGVIGGGLRALLGYYFKQQKLLEKLKAENKSLEAERIELMLQGFKSTLAQFENKITLVHGKLKMNTEAAERVIRAQTAFVSHVEKMLKLQDQRIEELYGTVKIHNGG